MNVKTQRQLLKFSLIFRLSLNENNDAVAVVDFVVAVATAGATLRSSRVHLSSARQSRVALGCFDGRCETEAAGDLKINPSRRLRLSRDAYAHTADSH